MHLREFSFYGLVEGYLDFADDKVPVVTLFLKLLG